MFYVRDEDRARFPAAFRRAFGADFLLFTKAEVLEKQLFGPGAHHPLFETFIGDFLAVSVSDKGIVESRACRQFRSNHAGMTREEWRSRGSWCAGRAFGASNALPGNVQKSGARSHGKKGHVHDGAGTGAVPRGAGKALQRTKGAQGIGTLSEKTLHAALKAYYEPDDESREVALGGFVADIVGEEGIIEIQTRSFERLRGKLEAFLEAARVTVVYPVAVERQLRWIDPETGEVLPPRGSTKKGIPFDVLPELYKIKPLLTHPTSGCALRCWR